VRLSQFNELIQDEFGSEFSKVIIHDTRLGALGDKTPKQLLELGEDPVLIWRAICEQLGVPKERWHGKPKIKRHAE
jgi:hypothetical protein